MKKSELDAARSIAADDAPPSPLVVICDQCRAQGIAGDDPFADLADLLTFTPVPRRLHADGWNPERQRAFIAALVVTGSPRRAARAIGKHAFGAEQLRKARGGSSFAAAWDAALDIAAERETARLKADLAELADQFAQESADRARAPGLDAPPHDHPARTRQLSPPPMSPRRQPSMSPEEEDWFSPASRQEYLDGRAAIRDRLTRARRLFLSLIHGDPDRRAAWEVLVGPVDWDAAERLDPQPDEPFADPEDEEGPPLPTMRKPDMLLVAEAGLIPDIAGGKDLVAELMEEVARVREAESTEPKETDGEADALT